MNQGNVQAMKPGNQERKTKKQTNKQTNKQNRKNCRRTTNKTYTGHKVY